MSQDEYFSVRTLKCLKIDNVKLFELEGDQKSNLTRGSLIVCYSPEFDRFVFCLNSFRYALSITLPTMAFLSPKNGYRSYILPKINGHYIVKLKTIPPPAVLQNLETILSNYSQFSYNSGQETELENQAKRQEYPESFNSPYDVKPPPKNDYFSKSKNAIHLGGEFLKQKIIKAADFIGKNIYDPKYLNSNELNVKTIEELKAGDYPENETIDFPRNEFEAMILLSNQIEKQAFNKDPGLVDPRTQPRVEPTGWEGLKKTTVDSSKSLWKGMNEAGFILSNAFAKKRVKKTNEPKQTGFQRENPYQPTRNVSQATQTSTIGQPDTGMTQQYTPPNVMQETNVYGMQQPNMNVNQPYINPTLQPNIYTVQLPSVETNQPSSNIAKVPPIDQNQQTYTHTEIKEERIEPGLGESNVFERKVNIYPSLDENVSGYIKYDHFAPTDPTYIQSVTEGQSSKEENTRPNFMDFTPKG